MAWKTLKFPIYNREHLLVHAIPRNWDCYYEICDCPTIAVEMGHRHVCGPCFNYYKGRVPTYWADEFRKGVEYCATLDHARRNVNLPFAVKERYE